MLLVATIDSLLRDFDAIKLGIAKLVAMKRFEAAHDLMVSNTSFFMEIIDVLRPSKPEPPKVLIDVVKVMIEACE